MILVQTCLKLLSGNHHFDYVFHVLLGEYVIYLICLMLIFPLFVHIF